MVGWYQTPSYLPHAEGPTPSSMHSPPVAPQYAPLRPRLAGLQHEHRPAFKTPVRMMKERAWHPTALPHLQRHAEGGQLLLELRRLRSGHQRLLAPAARIRFLG